jgi:poly-gamma-glutamate capsule biosynthesis protein CapA/YwtB (metallophosphatase superfamily)
MNKKIISVWLIILFFLTSCDGFQGANQNNQLPKDTKVAPELLGDKPEQLDPEPLQEPQPESYITEATLVAVGDIMMHSPQIPAGYNAETKTYNYNHFFSEVQPILAAGDWVIGNLETPIAGADKGYSGYPQFNAPEALADALKYAGLNILSTANNHSLDRRETGVLKTIDHLRDRDLLYTGTAKSQEEADQQLIVTKNDISMAILAYTYGTNGIPVPEGKKYLVNLLDKEQMIEAIHKAREADVDVVTIALHFGQEYQRDPSQQQRELVRDLIAAGADIILGSHPHVVQPYETIEVSDDKGNHRSGFVIYSLGNFISNQGPAQGTAKYTDVGLILNLTIQKQYPEGTVRITAIEPVHTWVHKYYDPMIKRRNYRIIPIESTVTLKEDELLGEQEFDLLDGYLADMDKHLKSLLFPDKPSAREVTSDVYQ